MKTKIAITLLFLISLPLLAEEGKWTPRQILELDPAWLKKQGLEIPPSRLWDAKKGTGLLSAAIQVGGCSGGFISDKGLIVTNHHCLFPILQQHSSPGNDIITKGYLARTPGEELPGKTIRATIPRRFTDVTSEISSAAPKGATPDQRAAATESKRKSLVAECEKKPGASCRVYDFDGGLSYVLVETTELSDIRLVYAPARAVGEYGGEIDNWMWPRHTGDFAIARAYVAPDGTSAMFDSTNVAYRPEFFFPIAKQGVRKGDFVMIPGYPGVTYRSLTADEMAERQDFFFPRREEVFGEWIRILEESSKGNEAGTIAVADHLKSLLNRYKNAQGQLDGFRRGRIVERQKAADAEVLAWAKSRPEFSEAVEAHSRLAALNTEQRGTWERDFLLALLGIGVRSVAGSGPPIPKSLYFPVTLVRLAKERGRAEGERSTDFREKDFPRIRQRLEDDQKGYFDTADKLVLAAWIDRVLGLPEAQRVAAIDQLFRGKSAGEIRTEVDRMYTRTRVFDLAERLKMFEESVPQLRERRDPLLDFALALDDELQDLDRRRASWDAQVFELRPAWRRAVIGHAGQPVSPDANRTLRVSLAHVKGYEPRDGVFYRPFTTLSGVVEKHTNKEPFDVPDAILAAAARGDLGPWRDPALDDVPVNFLSDGDTTGGNSGSPTLNGKGELVGINFDRVWENVANDFGYNPEIARNINADVRYLLWILDEIENADALLLELGIRKMVQKE